MQGKHLIAFFFLFPSLWAPSSPRPDGWLFQGFKGAAGNLSLNGDAEIQHSGILRLTNTSIQMLGRAFYSSPVRFKNASDGEAFSFSTAFAFAIATEFQKLGGHGIAFTISPTMDFPGAFSAQYLGLLNTTDQGNSTNHILAVEFDTVQNLEFEDMSNNHVGIDINSLKSAKAAEAAYIDDNSVKHALFMKDGQVLQAWVDYDSGKNQLTVRLSPESKKPLHPILSLDIDLSPVLQETMYVGFSSASGLPTQHCLLGWSFSTNGEATSLLLSSLPPVPRRKGNHRALVAGASFSAAFLILVTVALAFHLIRKIKNADVVEEWELHVGPHRYSYQELKQATKGFKDKQVLGSGGFGKVYKGTLPKSETEVAVKRVSHESKQGLREFVSEIASIGRLRHRNLVHLLGWCRRHGDLLLVYDYMPNGSLDKHLFGEPEAVLSWELRFSIIKGVASGLLYLHEGWEQTVIHRDIKAGNVLLDAELNARLGDFGLAKLYERGADPATTRVVGTLGYLAPELTRTGKPTTSSDVFAFGALLLEVVCGRRPIDHKASPEEFSLVEWVWEKCRVGAILEVVDPKLKGVFSEAEAVVVLKLALMCSNSVPGARPTMRQVVRYLEGEASLPESVLLPLPMEAYAGKRPPFGASGEYQGSMESYPLSSSHFDKFSVWSYSGNHPAAAADAEAASATLSLSDAGEGR